MKGVTFLIEKLVTTTYKKLGINGILLLLIFIGRCEILSVNSDLL